MLTSLLQGPKYMYVYIAGWPSGHLCDPVWSQAPGARYRLHPGLPAYHRGRHHRHTQDTLLQGGSLIIKPSLALSVKAPNLLFKGGGFSPNRERQTFSSYLSQLAHIRKQSFPFGVKSIVPRLLCFVNDESVFWDFYAFATYNLLIWSGQLISNSFF